VRSVNGAELREHFGQYLSLVEQGEEVRICKRNKSVARIQRVPSDAVRNGTRLGCARGSVRILGDIVAPAFSDEDWEMSR
jgi:prevent-host-death family protein